MPDLVPIGGVDIGEAEVTEVLATLRSGWLTTGPRVREFEERCKKHLGCAHAVAVQSGTAALHLALSALGLGEGDEVITTPLTFAATVNAILYVGATPVLADVDSETLQLSPADVAAKLGPKTKAILVVHYGGAAADMAAFESLAKPTGVAIVEDAALAFGASDRGKRVGQGSLAACFSFHPVKNLTTGEGGLLATCDPALAERARLRSWHGIDKTALSRYEQPGTWAYDVKDLGFKYNMTDIQAAIGIHQVARVEEMNRRRRQLASEYDLIFRSLRGVALPPETDEVTLRLPYWMVLDPTRYDRNRFIEALRRRGVGSAVHYIPIHFHSYYRNRFGWDKGMCPLAERAFEGLVSIPLFGSMTAEQHGQVKTAVVGALEESTR